MASNDYNNEYYERLLSGLSITPAQKELYLEMLDSIQNQKQMSAKRTNKAIRVKEKTFSELKKDVQAALLELGLVTKFHANEDYDYVLPHIEKRTKFFAKKQGMGGKFVTFHIFESSNTDIVSCEIKVQEIDQDFKTAKTVKLYTSNFDTKTVRPEDVANSIAVQIINLFVTNYN